MRRTFLAVLVLIAVLLWSNSLALAAWKVKVTSNQVKARAYIEHLMNGADPEELERPHIRYDEKFQAKRANREISQAMDQAEELARAGKHEEIVMPVFKAYLTQERYLELLEESKGYRGSNR